MKTYFRVEEYEYLIMAASGGIAYESTVNKAFGKIIFINFAS
jgi:hypothetical protein